MVHESQRNWTKKIWCFQNTLSYEEKNVENAQNFGFTLLGLSFKIILDPWKFTIYLTDTRFLILLHWYLQVSFKFQYNLVRFHIKTYMTDPFWSCHTFLYAILTIILGGLLHKKLGSLIPLILQQFLQTRWKLPAKKEKISMCNQMVTSEIRE